MSTAQKVLEFAQATSAWRGFVRHDPGERQYELVRRDAETEIYLVCWMPGHDTGFHDHDDSEAAILVVAGEVVEERLSLEGAISGRYGAGEVVEVPAEAIHRVRHAGDAPSVTLHAYSPPLRRVGTYEFGDDGTIRRWSRDADTPLEAATAT